MIDVQATEAKIFVIFLCNMLTRYECQRLRVVCKIAQLPSRWMRVPLCERFIAKIRRMMLTAAEGVAASVSYRIRCFLMSASTKSVWHSATWAYFISSHPSRARPRSRFINCHAESIVKFRTYISLIQREIRARAYCPSLRRQYALSRVANACELVEFEVCRHGLGF